MSVKFIHTADWQIGKNYDRIQSHEKRERLKRARLEAVDKIGGIAREKGAQFVLVAGDLFDSPTADKATIAAGLSAIGKLGVPVIAIPGNHDHGGPGGLWELDFFKQERERLAPNLTVLLEPVPFETEWAWILPCPLLRRAQPDDPCAWVRAADLARVRESGKPVILLAHGSAQAFGTTGYDDEEGDAGASNLIDLQRLPKGLVDYAALGDWHGTKSVEPWAWYSGTHEPDRFTKGGDHDPGNVLLVEVARGAAPRVAKIPTALIAWHGLQFEFGEDASVDIFAERLQQLVGARVDEDLLQLDISGSLGLDATSRLRALLEDWDARLLRLKVRDTTRVAATREEIERLTTQSSDPLIGLVAASLVESAGNSGEEGAIAALALQELFAAASPHANPDRTTP